MLIRLFSIVMVIAFFALPFNSRAVSAQQGGTPGARSGPGRDVRAREGRADGLVVRFKPGALPGGPSEAAGRARGLGEKAGHALVFLREMSGEAYVYRFERSMPAGQARAAARRILRDPAVEWAEPDLRLYPALAPNDSRYAELWGLAAASAANYGIDAPAAWDITTGDPNLAVAVIDTGILKDHPELSGRFLGGYDFVSADAPGVFFTANDGDGRDADASDPGDWVAVEDISEDCGPTQTPSSWHGSHVAGTIGAAANNGQGIAGVNWSSKLVPVRALGKCGGTFSDIADAIRWSAGLAVPGVPANPNPARVINLSLGGYSNICPTGLQDAITQANSQGAVVVVAGGNEAISAGSFTPANCAGVIAVGASEMGGYMAGYSNFGTTLTISAPGGDFNRSYPGKPTNAILSTINSSATFPGLGTSVIAGYQGTSMASPHVAGIVSLMLSVNPSLTRAQVVQMLQETATPYNALQNCAGGACGQAGIAHAGRAVQRAASELGISSPTQLAPAYAGLPGAPAPFQVTVRQAVTLANSSAKVGGMAAVVQSAAASGGDTILTVQPPNMPQAGYYDLAVTAAGKTYTVKGGVLYGVLPAADAFSVDEDSPETALDVLANDANAQPGTVIAAVGAAGSGQARLEGGQVRYRPAPNFYGTDTFTYAVQNGASFTSAAVTVTVVNDHADPPVIAAIGPRLAPAGALLSFTVSATDPDGDTALSYSAAYQSGGETKADLPVGSVFSPFVHLFSWLPTDAQVAAQPYTIVFTVTDSTLRSAQETVQITVVPGLKKQFLPSILTLPGNALYTGWNDEYLPVELETDGQRSHWQRFVVVLEVEPSCYEGFVQIEVDGPGPILNNQFFIETDGGTFRVSGQLQGSGAASGTYTFNQFNLWNAGCALLTRSGSWSVTTD